MSNLKSSSSIFFLGLVLLLGFTSCSDITNNIYVAKDGSVITEISIEPHTFFPMDMMKDVVGDSTVTDEVPTINEEDDKLMGKLFMGVQQLDTTFNLTGIEEFEKMKDSIPIEVFVEDILLKYKGDTTAQSSKLAVKISQTKDQYHGMVGLMEMLESDPDMLEQYAMAADKNINSRENFATELQSIMKTSGKRTSMFWDKGVFTLSRMDMQNLQEMTKVGEQKNQDNPLNEMGGDFGGMANEIDLDDEFTREMMTSMFGRVITKVHLPGKVEFTNDTTAVIEGNTVSFQQSVIEMMLSEDGNSKDRIIKFKK
ncbi:MAG: hypothetical protein HKN09_04610 [Saprospiraceae bacterium]|nr:hypothetical protein [Saprospiraceae bacterium]